MPKRKSTKTIKPDKKAQEGDELPKRLFTPRYGVRIRCSKCGYTFRGGGYLTEEKADDVEKEQKKIHKEGHKLLEKQDSKDEDVETERDYHAAEIPHEYVEVSPTTAQTTAVTTFADVTNASIASTNFTANQDHLVIATAHIMPSNSTNEIEVRMVRGTTPTEITDSLVHMEAATASTWMTYNWWGIVNTNPAETLKMQFRSTSTGMTATIDLISISVIQLTPDLTLNTNYRYAIDTDDTTISTFDTDTTTNNASVTHTPAVGGHRWLILSKARFGGTSGITPDRSVESRISRTGAATNDFPLMMMEGEDTGTVDTYVLVGVRTDTLTAVSHTYTEISQAHNNTGLGSTNPVRTDSAIFMLDLDSFKNAEENNEDNVQEDLTTATDYGQQIHTEAITTTQTGDVMCLGFITMDCGGSSDMYTMRMQINNTDNPPDYTAKGYDISAWDTTDRLPHIIHTIPNLSAATHNIDLDGSLSEQVSGSKGSVNRNITAFTMELNSSSLNAISSDTVGITEVANRYLGRQLTKISSDTVGITEVSNRNLSNATNFLTSSNLQLRLSGGSSNSNPDAAIGGARSSEVVGTRLFDHVSITEAQSGDVTPDHRCIYIFNTHTTLAMSDVKIWISANTQGDDFIEMGLGNSAVGSATSETAIANEGTAPSPTVTFTLAASEATAITVSSIPALNHKAIWIRRTVPAGTNFPVSNNSYSIMAKFLTNHS